MMEVTNNNRLLERVVVGVVASLDQFSLCICCMIRSLERYDDLLYIHTPRLRLCFISWELPGEWNVLGSVVVVLWLCAGRRDRRLTVQSTLRAARAHNKPAPSRYLTHPYLCKVECDVVCCVVGSCVKRTTTTHNKTRLIVLPYHPTNHNRFFFFLYVLDIIVKLPSSCRTYYLL